MPQNNDRKERDLSQYDAMSTEELSEILRLDSETPEGNGLDIDTLLYITGVLAERQKSTNTGKTAQEAWKSFQQNYLETEDECPAVTAQEKPVKTKKTWVRRLIAAAAILVLLISIPVTAKALGWEDICNTVVQWAKETFSFVRGDQRSIDGPIVGDAREYNSLQEALDAMEEDFDAVPTWIPEGYVLDEIIVDRNPVQRSYMALYEKDEQRIKISVQLHMESDPQKIEANENIIDTVTTEKAEYFIVSNNEKNKAIWMIESFECSISGDLTVDEIKQMINSIPEG